MPVLCNDVEASLAYLGHVVSPGVVAMQQGLFSSAKPEIEKMQFCAVCLPDPTYIMCVEPQASRGGEELRTSTWTVNGLLSTSKLSQTGSVVITLAKDNPLNSSNSHKYHYLFLSVFIPTLRVKTG